MHVQSPPGGVDTLAAKGKGKNAQSSILKALKEGMPSMGLKDDSLVFVVAPDEFEWGIDGAGGSSDSSSQEDVQGPGGRRYSTSSLNSNGLGTRSGSEATLVGDVFVVKSESLDVALWKIGGAAVGLRLVQLASVRALFLSSSSKRVDI